MARMPGATWQPLAADWNQQPRMRAHDIVCIHTMVGTLVGTDGLFRVSNGPGYSGTESHYGTGEYGEIVQWQDTAFAAEANYLGNPNVISIENADWKGRFGTWSGSNVPPFTPEQIESIAKILAWECSRAAHAACPSTWACHQGGIPLELIPDSKPGRRGIAPHRLGVPGYMVAGGVQWSTSQGKACPGDRRIAQIPQIIARAKQLTATPEDDIMAALTPADEAAIKASGSLIEAIAQRSRQVEGADPRFGGHLIVKHLAKVLTNQAVQAELIKQLADKQGTQIDMAAIEAVVEKGVADAIQSIETTVRLEA